MKRPQPPIDTSPIITKQVLEYLERLFPAIQPRLQDIDRVIWIRVGHQDVLEKVRDLYNKQQKE